MTRRGRPRGTIGEVSQAFIALTAERGHITAAHAASALQLSYRHAVKTAFNLRVSGHLVAVPPPAPGASRGLWMGLAGTSPALSAAAVDLSSWLRGR